MSYRAIQFACGERYLIDELVRTLAVGSYLLFKSFHQVAVLGESSRNRSEFSLRTHRRRQETLGGSVVWGRSGEGLLRLTAAAYAKDILGCLFVRHGVPLPAI